MEVTPKNLNEKEQSIDVDASPNVEVQPKYLLATKSCGVSPQKSEVRSSSLLGTYRCDPKLESEQSADTKPGLEWNVLLILQCVYHFLYVGHFNFFVHTARRDEHETLVLISCARTLSLH